MTKEIGVCLTTAAKLIGVRRQVLIKKLFEEDVITRNADAAIIAHERMTKLQYFFNELVKPQNKSYLEPVEVLKATTAGMEFLRDFCSQHNIEKVQPKKPVATGPNQLSIQGKLAKAKCHEIANA